MILTLVASVPQSSSLMQATATHFRQDCPKYSPLNFEPTPETQNKTSSLCLLPGTLRGVDPSKQELLECLHLSLSLTLSLSLYISHFRVDVDLPSF